MRYFLLYTSLFSIFLLWSCGGDSDPAPNTPDNPGGEPGEEVVGCTDPNSANYNPEATTDDGSCEYPFESSISANPQTFTTKVLIEQMTGTWCGWCVDGAYRMSQLIEENDNRVIGAAVHSGDEMEVSSIFNYLNSKFRVSGFPSGMVHRTTSNLSDDVVMGRDEWRSNAEALLEQPANVGLALEAQVDGNTLNVLAHLGVNEALEGNYSLMVYLLQDGVISAQENYYSSEYGNTSFAGHPYYDQPSTLFGYRHNHVVRESLSEMAGSTVMDYAKVEGGTMTRLFTTDIGGYNTSRLRVVAFVSRAGSSRTSNILNVQEVTVTPEAIAVKDFD